MQILYWLKISHRIIVASGKFIATMSAIVNSRNEDFANSEILPMVLVSRPGKLKIKITTTVLWVNTRRNPPFTVVLSTSIMDSPENQNSSKVLPDSALQHLGEMLRFLRKRPCIRDYCR